LSDEPDDDDTPPEGSRDAGAVGKMPNAADDTAIEKAQRRAKHVADKSADFWRRVLSEEIGRRVMWEVLVGMHTFEERFAVSPAGFPNPEATWFQAGEKAAGWRLYDALRKADFTGVHRLHLENDPYFKEKANQRK